MSQTAYQQDPTVALEGGLVDISTDRDLITGTADAAIIFGRFVHRVAGGPADDRPPRVDLPALTGDVTGATGIGFATNDVTIEAPGGWAVDSVVRILRSGRIWMLAEDAVTLGAAVFVRFQGGGEGRVRSDADVGNAVALPGATFRSAAGAGELAIVEYRPQT